MTESTAVEQAVPASVPALVTTPALEIEASDVQLPRLYIGQFSSDQVQDEKVKVGELFTALGQEDPDPQVVSAKGEDAAGVLIHVLGMRKGKSLSKDGELELYAYDDPEAPADAWVTYNYAVALPEVDQELPYKMLWTRSATPAAKQLNLVLSKNAGSGPPWTTAFRVRTAFRENEKGKWYVPRVSVVEADEDNVTVAANLAALIASQPATEFKSGGDEPAI